MLSALLSLAGDERVRMQESSGGAILKTSEQISCALACADRHTGPCTTSISISTEAVRDSLSKFFARTQASLSPTVLLNVVSLQLVLDYSREDDEYVRRFANWLLQRVPSLIAARIYYPLGSWATLLPLLHLKHLDLCMQNLETLGSMSFSALVPELESARISSGDAGTPILRLDFSGCQHMVRLVVANSAIVCLLKSPQCRLRIDMLNGDPAIYEGTSAAQQGLPNVKEIFLDGDELCDSEGLLQRVCLPELEVIRCDWPSSLRNGESDELDTLMHCSRHSRSVPALKSVLCGDHRMAFNRPAVKVRIPSSLAGVHEMMLATMRPLVLAFDSACSAGESLSTFFVVASEVRIDLDPIALLDLTDALAKRGLILSMAQAGLTHEHAPSQCMYVRAVSAPQLSYDEAVQCVNKRMGTWARHEGCADCGACWMCLMRAGLLD